MSPEQKPEDNSEIQPHYSGPYPGDERDPVTFKQVLPDILDQIETAGSSEVTQARQALADLLDIKNRGERIVSDEELAAARATLHNALGGNPDS